MIGYQSSAAIPGCKCASLEALGVGLVDCWATAGRAARHRSVARQDVHRPLAQRHQERDRARRDARDRRRRGAVARRARVCRTAHRAQPMGAVLSFVSMYSK